jgi:hypothetical protein
MSEEAHNEMGAAPIGEATNGNPVSKAFDLEKQKGEDSLWSSFAFSSVCVRKWVFTSELLAAVAMESLPSRAKQSPKFKQFFESQLCDDFLCANLDHFAALLRVEDMMNARTAGKKPQDILPPSNEEKQAAALLDQTVKEVSTYYCYIIMQFSSYKAAQQDRIFFESLYELASNVVCAAFPTRHRFKIEDEIGRIVRTDTFNLTKRNNDANHHTKMYFTSREFYVLRHAGDGFMGRKILAALHPRRLASESVNLTVKKRSPLVVTLLPSPAEVAANAAKEMAAAIKKKGLAKTFVAGFDAIDEKRTRTGAEELKSLPKIDRHGAARSASPVLTWERPGAAISSPKHMTRNAKTVGGDVDLVRQRLGRSLPFSYS